MRPGIYTLAFLSLAACAAPLASTRGLAPLIRGDDGGGLRLLWQFSASGDLRTRDFGDRLFGRAPTGPVLMKPYGVAVLGAQVFVVDSGLRTVLRFDMRRGGVEDLQDIGGQRYLQAPLNIAASAEGLLYVTDLKRRQVVVVDRDGRLVRALGDGASFTPAGITLWGDEIVITDLMAHRLLRLDKHSGRVLGELRCGDTSLQRQGFPSNVTVDAAGTLYVTETLSGGLYALDQDGTCHRQPEQTARDTLLRPKGVAHARDGSLYVADALSGAVHRLDSRLRSRAIFGDGRLADPVRFSLPAGLSISSHPAMLAAARAQTTERERYDYVLVVVSQLGDKQISVLGHVTRRKGVMVGASDPGLAGDQNHDDLALGTNTGDSSVGRMAHESPACDASDESLGADGGRPDPRRCTRAAGLFASGI